MDVRSRDEEKFQRIQASLARSFEIYEEVAHLFKDKKVLTESEMARHAQEVCSKIEIQEWSDFDEEDYLLQGPGLLDCPPSPVTYTYRPFITYTPPPPPPRPLESYLRKMKSLSLDEQALEKKTDGQSSEINDKHGHKKNNNRVVSKRKQKRGRNMEKKRS